MKKMTASREDSPRRATGIRRRGGDVTEQTEPSWFEKLPMWQRLGIVLSPVIVVVVANLIPTLIVEPEERAVVECEKAAKANGMDDPKGVYVSKPVLDLDERWVAELNGTALRDGKREDIWCYVTHEKHEDTWNAVAKYE